MELPSDDAAQITQDFIARRITLRHLRILQALYRENSLSAAAEALHVTQPAVSKALTEIEEGLGQTLFARKGRSLRPTPLALRLIEMADRIDSVLRRSAEDAACIVRGTQGELLIGATNAALPQVLPDAMARMKQEYPAITLSVRTHALSDLVRELRQGRIDLVLARITPTEAPADLEGHLLLHQQEVLVVSTNHPLAQHRRVDWPQLKDQAWIGHLPGTRMRVLLNKMWQERDLGTPTNLIETGDIAVALSMMKRLPLVALVPAHVARLAALQGLVKILPLEPKVGLADLSMWHLRETQSPMVERFKQLLHEAAQAGLNSDGT